MASAMRFSLDETVKENASDNWPKWKIGLAVGAPIAVVMGGLWYYKRRNDKNKKTRISQAGDEEGQRQISSPSSREKPSSSASEKSLQALTPLDQAQAEKNKGNKYFKGGRYDQAINCYTEAIKVCPPENKQELSTFYQNRAAAFEKLKNTKMVVEDCTAAIQLNPKYSKALSRRAVACEQLDNLSQSLEDVTALCILEGFQNPQSLVTADRILKKLGLSKAKEAYKNKKPTMPSKHFIRTYFYAFINDPVLNAAREMKKTNQEQQVQNGETDVQTESFYHTALQQLNSEEYADIIRLCTEEMNMENSSHKLEATLLRGTFYFLSSQIEEALADFNNILAQETVNKRLKVNALIKRGSLHIQQEKQTDGLGDLATAVRMDPENADIYHHRGHHNIQLERLDDALKDLDNAISKSPSFAASHVQKSFVEHKRSAMQMAQMNLPLPQSVLESYKHNVEMFPNYGDARALYAQALGDGGKFDEADREFQKAIELEPDNATAIVHRGLLQLQWKQNLEEATAMIKSALTLDDKCEYAYEVLGTLEVQQGKMDKALGYFQKAISLSRTESEMAHLYSLLEAAQAQLKVAKNLGIPLPNMAGPSMTMQ